MGYHPKHECRGCSSGRGSGRRMSAQAWHAQWHNPVQPPDICPDTTAPNWNAVGVLAVCLHTNPAHNVLLAPMRMLAQMPTCNRGLQSHTTGATYMSNVCNHAELSDLRATTLLAATTDPLCPSLTRTDRLPSHVVAHQRVRDNGHELEGRNAGTISPKWPRTRMPMAMNWNARSTETQSQASALLARAAS